jgi:hypothetical protein
VKNPELKSLNIRHFKLTSGDELIALVSSVDESKRAVYVERPLLLRSNTVDDTDTYYLSDWMPASTEVLTAINILHIIAQSAINDQAKLSYIKYCLEEPRGKATEDLFDDDGDVDADLDAYEIDDKTIFH